MANVALKLKHERGVSLPGGAQTLKLKLRCSVLRPRPRHLNLSHFNIFSPALTFHHLLLSWPRQNCIQRPRILLFWTAVVLATLTVAVRQTFLDNTRKAH